MLDKYFHPEDWHKVRFSNKVHFGYETKDKLKIIQKVSIHYCPNCIEKVQKPMKKDKKRYYC